MRVLAARSQGLQSKGKVNVYSKRIPKICISTWHMRDTTAHLMLPAISGGPRPSLVKRHFYVVGKGNNSRLILKALRERPWLAPAPQHGSLPKLSRGQKCFYWEMYRKGRRYAPGQNNLVYNHLEGNASIVTKKGLYYTMKEYCGDEDELMQEYMPLTFCVPSGSPDNQEFQAFLAAFDRNSQTPSTIENSSVEATQHPPISAPRKQPEHSTLIPDKPKLGAETNANNLWILKPASCSNRGSHIRLSNCLAEIENIVREEARQDARCGGWIIQKYIERPLLVQGRKFDIRIFVLLVTDRANGSLHGYIHTKANYIRTSSERYSLSPAKLGDRFLHLTNDGVQKKSMKYSKYEVGNKLTLQELVDYMLSQHRCAPNWLETGLLPRIRQLVLYTIDASREKLNPHRRRNCFELLGYDFMIDENLKVWLIEINSNPCLELCCPHLERELPHLIADTMQVALDHVLPPPGRKDCTERCAEAIHAIGLRSNGFEKIWPERLGR